jgi:succinoglycan biosynthesis transport protein ExoP
MQLVEYKPLLPTRRDLAARVFRKRTVFFACLLLVVAGFIVTSQFQPKYQAEMKILVRKERVDPIVTTEEKSTPELQTTNVAEEDLNSEAQLLKGDDLLHDVVLQAGLVPAASNDPVAIAKAARKLTKNLDVSVIEKTNLISVTYVSPNPEQSQRVLETLATLYLAKHIKLHGQDFQVSFFEKQVLDHGEALKEAEAKLLEFTQQTGITSADLERDLTIRQFKDLSLEKIQTQADIADTQARTGQLAALVSGEPNRIPTASKSADNPQLLNQLKGTMLTLQLKRTELLNKYDPDYRLVKDVDREIATTQALLDAQAAAPVRESSSDNNPTRLTLQTELAQSRALLTGLRSKESQLLASSASLEQTAEVLTQRGAEQDVLLRKVKTEKDLLQLTTDKLEQAKMARSLNKGGILNVAVTQAPQVPALPLHSPLAVLAATLFTGCLLSMGAAFISDIFDPTVRNGEELAEVLSAPLLAQFGQKLYLERGPL